MKKINMRTVLPCVLMVIFVAVGVLMLVLCVGKLNNYNDQTDAALRSAAEAEASAAQNEAELARLQEENQAMEQDIADLEQQNAALDAEAERLQQEYDTLAQDEDNLYYLTIIESLTEGMKLVESYINEAQ